MSEILIRGGQVIDGTGAPAERLDVLVVGRRIARLGQDILPDAGTKVIDAEGAIVAPGFIDCHTHFDASLFWDPRCDPMPEHGVTTVLIGNCSLGLAPVTEASKSEIADVFSFIEDIPRDLFNSMVPWNWETYADFAKSLSAGNYAVNVVGLVPHSWLRTFVIGRDAWKREATDDEIVVIAAELDGAMKGGALGMSTSQFDKDSSGRRVPSALANDAELDALFRVIGEHRGISQLIPRHPDRANIREDWFRFGKFAGRYDVPILVNDISDPVFNDGAAQETLGWATTLQESGSPVFPMLSPRSVDISINFHHTMSFIDIPAWNDIVRASDEDKRRLLADDEWRARARGNWDNCKSMLFPNDRIESLRIISVGDVPDLKGWIGRHLVELIQERGEHPSDVLADWVLETNLQGKLVYPITNQRPEVIGELLNESAIMYGASDAGAHFQAFCGAGDTTLLLTRHVRDRKEVPLERAIHGLTGRQAELMRLSDRGVIQEGAIADLVIFHLDELAWRPEHLVADVPGGIQRLQRPPGGYRYTLVAGEIVQAHGEPVDVLPGKFLRAEDR